MDTRSTQRGDFSTGLRVLLGAAGVVVIVAGLRTAAPILVPFAIALFVAIASLPPLRWFRRHGIPNFAAVFLIVLLDAVVLGFLGWIVLRSAAEVRDAFPHYAVRLVELEDSLLRLLRGWGLEIDAVPYTDLFRPERVFDLVSTLLRGLTEVVSVSIVVMLFLIFTLSEATDFPAKLRAAVGDRAEVLQRYTPIVEEVQQYLALKTLISLATGLLIGLAAALLGVDFALFWGLLAFLLNYVPNIGSIIAAVPAVSLALLQLGPAAAAALAAAYLAVNLVIGNLVDPAVMGRRLGLSTLVIIISLVFWGWVWGVAGMLLSVPLTMAVKIALESTRQYRWIAVMLGPASPDRRTNAAALGSVPPPSVAETPTARPGA